MDREMVQLLISRGLDGDLDRGEMAQLYRLVAENPSLTVEMGEIAKLQEELEQLAGAYSEATPNADLAAQTMAVIKQKQRQQRSLFAIIQQFWHWLLSPKGLAVQPFSFAGGILVSLLVLWLSAPTLNLHRGKSVATPIATRLAIHDLQFVKAKARINWTNQFIVPPGGSTRLALDGGQEPVQMQFETVEPTRLTITHSSKTGGEEAVRSFMVSGVSYATLSQPSSGDAVAIENSGMVPVLVYIRNAGGVTVSDFYARNISRAL